MRDPERHLHVVSDGPALAQAGVPADAPDADRVRVVFKRAHEHAGVGYLAGAAALVSRPARDKLVRLGVIEG